MDNFKNALGQKWTRLNDKMPFLRLLELKATALPNVEKKGSSDPYATVEFQGTVHVNEF